MRRSDLPQVDIDRLGVIGAGRIGRQMVSLARTAGYNVSVAGTGARSDATAVAGIACSTVRDLIAESDVIALALPIRRFTELPLERFVDRVLIDMMNYWPSKDGRLPQFEDHALSSEIVSASLPNSTRVVKALNHFSYKDLRAWSRPDGADPRTAAAVASDHISAARLGCHLVDRLGYEPVLLEGLQASAPMQPGGELFGVRLTAGQMREITDSV